jgi:hypothetical protein
MEILYTGIIILGIFVLFITIISLFWCSCRTYKVIGIEQTELYF